MKFAPRARLGKRLAASVGVGVGVGLFVALAANAGALAGIRSRTSDALVFPRGETSDEVVVVAIDARSVAQVRQAWPWSRDTQAELVSTIAAAGARVVVLDIVLAPSTSNDDPLAAALRRIPSVIGAGVETTAATDRQWTATGVLLAANVIEPEPVFAAVASVGHTAVTPDAEDGVTRRVPLVVEADRRFRPSLALAALAVRDGAAPQVTVRPGAVQIGARSIPTDARHQLRISYPPTLVTEGPAVVPAADVLAGGADDRLRGKVVFVGVSDPVAGDRLLTPVAKRSGMAGVLVQASAYNTMATSAFLAEVSHTETVAWSVALAFIVALATIAIRLWAGVVAAGVAMAGFVLLSLARADRGDIVDVVYPVLAVLVALFVSAGLREVLVDRQRRQIANLFGQYVPPRVARELVGDERASGLLDGQRLDVTVLFCDIRGFTPVTAPLGPTEIRALLDTYYTVLSEIVLDHGGTVLRYTGDEILAVFGAPLATAGHARDAVTCAIAMHAAEAGLGEQLGELGLPPLRYGIGVQTGEVVSAVMGSDIRRQYAVVGTPLTLGSRLCSHARAGETLVSAETWDELGATPPVAEEVTLALKGRDEPVVLYRIRAGHAASDASRQLR